MLGTSGGLLHRHLARGRPAGQCNDGTRRGTGLLDSQLLTVNPHAALTPCPRLQEQHGAGRAPAGAFEQEPPASYTKASLALHVPACRNSAVKEVHLLGRRGPVQAAFTPKELRELLSLEGVQVGWHGC